jgi:hypothetical protein
VSSRSLCAPHIPKKISRVICSFLHSIHPFWRKFPSVATFATARSSSSSAQTHSRACADFVSTHTMRWSLFCECLAYIFHLSPSVSHKREALDLIALSPSVLDIVGFREINRQSAVDDSTPAVVDTISDTAWWNTMKRDLNLSQRWGLHAIHNLTLSGPAVLAAIESKLLDWTLRPHSIHLFVTLIGKRHTCGSAGGAMRLLRLRIDE